MTKRLWIGSAVLASAVAIAPALAQTTPPAAHDHDHAAEASQAPSPKSGMMMGGDHQKMMADMKVADDHLQELLTKMKTATGDQKVNAIADVVTQLVADQQKMHRHMADMHAMSSSHK